MYKLRTLTHQTLVFLNLLIVCVIIPHNGFSQLYLNEAMPQNESTIADNLGEFDDWIEVYNSSSTAIDLSGYSLTDDPTNLDKHVVKSGNAGLTTVPAFGYLLLWADQDINQGENHLDFKLSDGETVSLVAPDGSTVVSSLTLPSLKNDESFGSVTDGSLSTRIFEVPTPLSSNESSLDSDIQFSVSSRSFINSFTLSLTTNAVNGTLRYTTDGSNPTLSSPVYSGSIVISTTTTIKAIYFFNNGTSSLMKTERYVIMSSSLANTSSNLPIIMIHTYNQTLDQSQFKTTFWSLIEPNNGGRAYCSDEPSFSGRTAMKIRGATSSNYPKKQWRCELQNEDGSDRNEPLIGMPSDSDWTLYAPGRNDRALINNALMYTMSNKMGKWAPRTRFVEVYYNEGSTLTPSDYWGIYILTESIKVDKNRVDIHKLEPTDNTGEDLTGGYIYSSDRDPDITTTYSDQHFHMPNVGYRLKSPDGDDLTSTQLNYITNTITDFESSLTSNNWLSQSTGYKTKTNIESWMAPHLLNALAREPDGFYLSNYVQKDKNGLLEAGPIWDFDRAMKSTDPRSQNPIGWHTAHNSNDNGGQGNVYYWKGGQYAGFYINQMVNDPDYETLIYDRWFDWRRNGILKTSEMNALIDSMANALTESEVREYHRWGANYAEYGPRYGNFAGEISEMKNWLQQRTSWMDGEFLGPPNFSPESSTVNQNSTVTLNSTAGSGTIYYTLDGSDPRLPGGGISPTAISYSGAIPVVKKGLTFISARTRLNSGQWSAICTQEYFVAQNYSGLVINEIHYNPNDEVVNGDTIGGNNFEFIELKNCGTSNINLNGIDFIQGGVDLNIQNCLTIPPNGFVVLAENAQWFQFKYGFAPDASYGEQLNNGGELLYLVDPQNNLIDSLSYNDVQPWSGTPDKGFYSLALKDCAVDNSLAQNWSIQSVFTTPKEENNFLNFGQHSYSGIVINEIHYNPIPGQDAAGNPVESKNYQFIELKNISPVAIDLTGVFFSRGIDYFFPDNTMLNPGDFLVLVEDKSSFLERYGFNAFDKFDGKLSDTGETIWLNRLDTLLDAVTFSSLAPWDTQANGGPVDYSLALIDGNVNNDTHLNWQVQCSSVYTPGAENDVSCFPGLDYSGLTINEIHYATALGDSYEFVELYNNSNMTISLEEVSLSNAVTFKFQNQTIASNSYIILARDSALFENTYGVTPIGEYSGDLSNNGETILIKNLFNETIDSVQYGVTSPWTSQPSQGIKSLALINANLDNSLAENWCVQQTNITPGAVNVFDDADNDAVADCIDSCPNFDNNLIGTSCDDGDPCTANDMYDSSCNCVGSTLVDSDNDGICDIIDQCPNFNDNLIGTTCNDGNACTIGETYNNNCECAGGTSTDSDNDTVCDELDVCPGFDDTLIGQPCEDGDPCTTGESYDNSCNCTGGSSADTDGDGVCDGLDNNCLLIDYEDFENGLGLWIVNNVESFLSSSSNSPDGNQSLHIQDNTGLISSAHTQVLDLSSASQVELSFLYQVTGMFDSNVEHFKLEISTNGGSSFSFIKEWRVGIDFVINQVYDELVVLQPGEFSANTVFRFVCVGNINSDAVYLDNIKIDACPADCIPLLVENNSPSIVQSVSVGQYIETNGVVSSGNIEYQAENFISLNEGFEVKQGAVFHAYIAPCN